MLAVACWFRFLDATTRLRILVDGRFCPTTQLLREQTPMHVISEILGHATTAATMIYAKADVESLRGAALDTEELRHGD